jgi:tetratricopeptide (TPR) repeat protein
VRITARLLDATSGALEWSESYDRGTGDLFKTQDDIAAAVAKSLAIELVPRPDATGERTANTEAHTELLRARALLSRDYSKADLEAAARALEHAVELDPAYAPAVANLAVTQYFLRDFAASASDGDKLIKRALELGDKARSLGPNVGEVHAARGFLLFNITWDWAQARSEMQRAIELDPASSETLRMYGGLLALLGQTEDALATLKRAVTADPLSARAWAHLASLQAAVGERGEARKSLAKALELNPDSLIARIQLGELELVESHPDVVLELAKQINVPAYVNTLTAMTEHSLGHKAKADSVLAALIKSDRHTAAYQIAEIYAWRNETDKAFEWLDNALADHDAGLSDLRTDPLLGSLRMDPRYRALLTKLGL